MGTRTNYEFAFPLLLKYGLTATFFLTTGLLERDGPTVARFEQLLNVGNGVVQPLRWEQAREMVAEGMEVGAHSHTHANLARLPDAELEFEVTHSKDIIEERLAETRMFAFPFGLPRVHFTDHVIACVRRAGYELACSTVERGLRASDSPLIVPRMLPTRQSVEVLRDKVLGVWDLIGLVRERSASTRSRI